MRRQAVACQNHRPVTEPQHTRTLSDTQATPLASAVSPPSCCHEGVALARDALLSPGDTSQGGGFIPRKDTATVSHPTSHQRVFGALPIRELPYEDCSMARMLPGPQLLSGSAIKREQFNVMLRTNQAAGFLS